MTNKKELAIVFGITSNLTFALANVMLGLKKHSPAFADEIIVYHDNISENNQNLLKTILPTRFIKYEFPIKDTSSFDEMFFNQFSTMAYSRFECFRHLDEFKNVLWLDVDILIQKDLSGLLNYTKTGIGMLPGDFIKHNFKEPIEEFNMEKCGFWTGTIILTDKIKNYDKIADWCYKKLLEYAPKLYLPDQAIFNILLEEFKLEPMGIEKDVYCIHPNDKRFELVKNAIILHAFRPKKFWDCFRLSEWVENDKKWQSMGGTPYKGKVLNFIQRYLERKYPGSPDIFRKPRAFFNYVYMTRFKKSYHGMN